MQDWLQANLVSLLNGIALGVLLYVLAVGLSVMLGMLNMLNLAHGTLYLLGAYAAYTVVGPDAGLMKFGLALLLAIVVGAVAGTALELMARPLEGKGHMDEALLTLGIALAGGVLLSSVFGADIHSIPPPSELGSSVTIAGQPYPLYRLALIVAGLLVATGVEYVLERTTTGALIRAIVHDREQVSVLGVNVRYVMLGVFAASSALALVAGVLGGPILGAAPGLDGQVLLLAMVVVVIGGLGSSRGALIAALVVGVVQNLGTAISTPLAPFLIFGTMVAVLALRPNGLMGRAAVGR